MWRSTPFACAKSSIAEKLVPGCMSTRIQPQRFPLSNTSKEWRGGRALQNALCAYITIQGWASRAAGLFAASRSASSHAKNSDARLRFVFGFQTPADARGTVREMVVAAGFRSSFVRTVSGAHPLLWVHLRAVPDLRIDGDEVNQLSQPTPCVRQTRQQHKAGRDDHHDDYHDATHPGIPRVPEVVAGREGTGGPGSGIGSCVVETGKSTRVVHTVAASTLVVADCPHVCSRGSPQSGCVCGAGVSGVLTGDLGGEGLNGVHEAVADAPLVHRKIVCAAASQAGKRKTQRELQRLHSHA